MTFDDLENCIRFMYHVILDFCCLFVLHYTSAFRLLEIECVCTGEISLNKCKSVQDGTQSLCQPKSNNTVFTRMDLIS